MVITTIAVVAMVGFKDYVNRSEAIRAMEHLGQILLQYRKSHGQVPPESYVASIKDQLHGHVRLGNLQYRARWIDLESPPDEILAYSEQGYHFLVIGSGVIVLRLDGRVEWMGQKEFGTLLAAQQSPAEVQLQRK